MMYWILRKIFQFKMNNDPLIASQQKNDFNLKIKAMNYKAFIMPKTEMTDSYKISEYV